MSSAEPSVAVVMPAYNAAHLLPQVLSALMRAAGDDTPVWVVDPGSTDDTARVAESLGAHVVRLPHRAGPAHARNVGVEHVDADVIVFVDSDCVAHPDIIDRIRAAFAADPELVSLTGSYDSDPPEHGFFSQYMNLRHHCTHQQAERENASFWAGCGAVRRDAFLKVGGFDPERFPMPQIEDIELGLRLKETGRTCLDPDLNVTHLKRWSLRSVIETDIFARGLPWTELMLERGEVPNDLNLRTSQRIASALSPFVLFGMATLPGVLLLGAGRIALALLVLIGVSAALQWSLIRGFAELRGPLFAFGAWVFHQVHLFYSGVTFAICWVRHRLGWKSSTRVSS